MHGSSSEMTTRATRRQRPVGFVAGFSVSGQRIASPACVPSRVIPSLSRGAFSYRSAVRRQQRVPRPCPRVWRVACSGFSGGNADGDEVEDGASEQEDASGQNSDDVHVHRKGGKRKPYKGDLLPFDVRIISPPPSLLGRFKLDSHTNCGDIITHNGAHFLVKRVRMHYHYTNGRVEMQRKTVEVTSLARKAIELYLEKVLKDS